MVHIWKSGDRVESKNGGPVMEVINYIEEHNILVGKVISDHIVLCSWYDKDGHHQDTFHQHTLMKSTQPH